MFNKNQIIRRCFLRSIVSRLVIVIFTVSIITLLATPSLAFQDITMVSQKSEYKFNQHMEYIEMVEDENGDYFVDIQVSNMDLSDTLTMLTNKLNVGLAWSTDLTINQPVSFHAAGIEFYELLDALLHERDLEYLVSHDKNVLVIRKKEYFYSEKVKEQRTISGQVTDSQTGEALPGVNVIIADSEEATGSILGTQTDIEGNFSLNVPDELNTLIFTYIGYQRVEFNLDGRTTLNIQLQQDIQTLDDVVVVGYGVQRRSDVTGSVGSIDAETLQSRPTANIEQALSGRVAGVDVSINTGRPGGAPNIRVRGTTSVSNTNDPLYVVDGVMLNVERLQRGTHAISSINPSSIESIEILKDASATAIYGARGANGVVLITTNRGSQEGGRVSYNSYVSVGTASKKIDLLNSEEFLRVEEIAYENASKFDPEGFREGRYTNPVTKRTDPRLFDSNGNPLYDTDWQDEAFQNAVTHNHSLSFSGGNNQTTYGLDVSYRDEEGVMKDSWLNRYSGRFVIDTQINDWLNAGGSISYNNQEEKELEGWPMRMLYESIPIIPVRYPDGSWAGNEDYPGMEGGPNQRRVSQEHIYNIQTQNTISNIFTNIRLAEGLQLRSMVAANIINQSVNRYSGRDIPFLSRNQDGIASISTLQRENWQFENLLTYVSDLGTVHSINALLGQSIQSSNGFSSNASSWGFIDDYFQYNNLGIGSNPQPPGSSASGYSMASFFGRINYTYDQRYLFTVTGRVDGSSKFGDNNKYAFFPSAAFGWMVSEEDFLSDHSIISSLKLRTSYGLTGNSEIGNYQYDAGLGTYTAIFNGNRHPGVGISRLANPELRWETNAQFDIGLELGLFNNRISFEADVYHRTSRDMLLNRPVPRTSGYATVTENIGNMENRGLELSLTTFNINRSDFFWSTNFNYTVNKNKVLKLHGGSDIATGGGVHGGGAGSIIREGLPVNTFMGYIHLGTWGTHEAEEAASFNRLPGDIKYKDVNGDGAITPADQVPIGNGLPDGYGTLINTFAYKNIELSVDIQFMYGNDIMWEARHSTEDRVGISNSLRSVLQAWTPENQDTPIAQLRPVQAGYDTNNDTHRMEDGSFIRGRNLTFSYTLPQETISSWGIRNVRVYAAAQNFFTVTKFPGYDPEVSTDPNTSFARGRAAYFEYPKARVFMLGLNLDF